MLEDAGSQVQELVIDLALPVVDGLVENLAGQGTGIGVDRIGAEHMEAEWPAQRVVGRPEVVPAAVPAANRLPGGVAEDPPLARFHAGLVDPLARHGIVVGNYLTIERISLRTLIALDIQGDVRKIFSGRPVVGDGQKRAAERVEVCHRRCIRMRGRFRGGRLLERSEATPGPLGIPGGRVVPCREPLEEVAYVGISGRICLEDRVVDVPGLQVPGIEDDFLVRVVGIDGCDYPSRRVVAKDRADPDLHAELELVPGSRELAEERLILPNRLALVVEDRPAGSRPTAGRPPDRHRPPVPAPPGSSSVSPG